MCLNGATGPPLDNGARPFAVTPPHHRGRGEDEETERERSERKRAASVAGGIKERGLRVVQPGNGENGARGRVGP